MQRTLGLFQVNPVGLGCMCLSHAYGKPPSEDYAINLLNEALELGYNHLDTATLYGFGANEQLIAKALQGRRHQFVLASKCGLFLNDEGKRTLSGRPEILRKNCEDSLKRLNTEVIDLYYLHRLDKSVPIEDSVGALGELVRQGKLRSIGLSEVSAETLLKAHCEHPVSALQSEYSLWTRNPEIATLAMCKRLGITFVAFSPLGRGFLTDTPPATDSLQANDIRADMPRFSTENFSKNLTLLNRLQTEANTLGLTTAQLAIAWVLHQGEHVIAIPGTTHLQHLKDNLLAQHTLLPDDTVSRLNEWFKPQHIAGNRYPEQSQKAIDTESFTP